MQWNRIVMYPLLALVVLGGGYTAAQDKMAKDSKRQADRRAIDQLTKELIQAFDKRDAPTHPGAPTPIVTAASRK
jgi:hypothetical protein